MTKQDNLLITRRDVLKASGALVVSLGVAGGISRDVFAAMARKPGALAPTELDTYIAVTPDSRVTVFFGKMDMGQGLDTAIGQIVAEEIDVPFDHVKVIMGDTALCVNQGGGSAVAIVNQTGGGGVIADHFELDDRTKSALGVTGWAVRVAGPDVALGIEFDLTRVGHA